MLIKIHIVLTYLHYRVIELPWLFRELFDVDGEESILTWFSSALLLVTSSALALLYIVKRNIHDPYQFYWLGLSLGFLFISVDEVAGFHETSNSITTYSWVVPGLLVASVVFAVYIKFLISLPRSIALKFIFGGAIFVGGAVCVELATEPYLYNDELDTLAYNLWTAVEDGMEIGGVICFLYALREYAEGVLNLNLHVDLQKVSMHRQSAQCI